MTPRAAPPRRRRPTEGAALLSLDSFLDIVTNVVGVLVLVATVTVVQAGHASVPLERVLTRGRPAAARALFEIREGRLHLVDEDATAQGLRALAALPERPKTREELAAAVEALDLGGAAHRLHAELEPGGGVVWTYAPRPGARGDAIDDVGRPGSVLSRALARLRPGDVAYFVVRDGGFPVFERARAAAASQGLAIGWHPTTDREPVRLSATGAVGRRILHARGP